MAEGDKVLSQWDRRPMTLVRDDFLPYPSPDSLREWAWVWERMSVTFLHARQHECLPHWHIAPRRLPNAIAFFVHTGKARWQIGDAIVIAQPDDLLFIPEGVWHSAEHLPERRFCVSAIHFTARLFESLDILSVLGFPVHVPKLPEAGSVVNELLRLSARQPLGWQRRGAALVTDLLLRVVQERPDLFRPAASPSAVTALKILHPALQFAEDHLGERVTVTEMAEAAACSVRHLRRLFREVLGMSPKRWLIERRLQKVAHLLTQTDLPLKVIAAECGFDDLPHFHRLFRRRFGQSPAQFRRSAFRGL